MLFIPFLNIWKISVPHPGNQWPFWASITGPQLSTDCHISFLPTFRTKHVQRFPTWRASEPEQLWLWTLCARLKWFKWYHNWWSTIVAPQNTVSRGEHWFISCYYGFKNFKMQVVKCIYLHKGKDVHKGGKAYEIYLALTDYFARSRDHLTDGLC